MRNFTANSESLMNKTFSIVIPVYNRAAIVTSTLDSIAKQTYRPIHLILVDNNSSDNTLKILDEWKSTNETKDFKVTITSETVSGAAAARNKGLCFVKSEHMAFFDSDDTMRPTAVAEYIDAFTKYPNTDIVCCNALYHYLNGNTRLFYFRKGNILRNHIYHATLRTQGYAVRTEFFRRCGAWDNDVITWNDWETGIRLLLNDPCVISLGNTLVDIHMQESSITGLDFSSKAGEWEYALDKAEKVIAESSYKNKESLNRLIDYRRIVLSAHYKKEGNDKLARELYSQVMRHCKSDIRMRLIMPIVYRYVSIGGRGAATLIDGLI